MITTRKFHRDMDDLQLLSAQLAFVSAAYDLQQKLLSHKRTGAVIFETSFSVLRQCPTRSFVEQTRAFMSHVVEASCLRCL